MIITLVQVTIMDTVSKTMYDMPNEVYWNIFDYLDSDAERLADCSTLCNDIYHDFTEKIRETNRLIKEYSEKIKLVARHIPMIKIKICFIPKFIHVTDRETNEKTEIYIKSEAFLVIYGTDDLENNCQEFDRVYLPKLDYTDNERITKILAKFR